MRFIDTLMDKWDELVVKTAPMRKKLRIFWRDLKGAFRFIWVNFLRMKQVVLAIPVGIAAVLIALSNLANLPAVVGLQLAATGEFTVQVARELAVLGPLALTALCLLMLFLSRRTLTPWLVSVVSLLVPLFIYLLNTFPA